MADCARLYSPVTSLSQPAKLALIRQGQLFLPALAFLPKPGGPDLLDREFAVAPFEDLSLLFQARGRTSVGSPQVKLCSPFFGPYHPLRLHKAVEAGLADLLQSVLSLGLAQSEGQVPNRAPYWTAFAILSGPLLDRVISLGHGKQL
jgi:hypothetical protein